MKPELRVSSDLAEVLKASYETAAELNQSLVLPNYILCNAVGRPQIAQVLLDYCILAEGLQTSIRQDFKKLEQPKSDLIIPSSDSRRLLTVAMNEAHSDWRKNPEVSARVIDTSHVMRAAIKGKFGYGTILSDGLLGVNRERFLEEMLKMSQQPHLADSSFKISS